jgi:predicted glycosyltransferase
MVDVWLDAVTPKDSLLIYSLLPVLREKGYKILVTAKKQTQTTEILDLLKVDYICIGKYGKTLKEKLMAEQRRTLDFVDLFDKGEFPKVLWTHGDVAAIRTAFGLSIPIVYANDTVFAYHVARLVAPLVDWLIAPVSFGKSWSLFGIPRSRIVHYDGLEELAWMKNPKFEKPKFLQELARRKPVMLFRDAEYRASYCKEVKADIQRLMAKLAEIAFVVYLPRYNEEKQKFKSISNVWVPPKPVLTAQLIPYVDLMVGSGGTACRETALMGIPTINFHFWDVQARYLCKKGFPVQIIRNTSKIIQASRKILRNPDKYKINTKENIEKLESPVPEWVRHIENCLKMKR